MTSKWPWTLNSQKYLAYTKYFSPCQKSEMHRMTSDCFWTLNGKKYLVYSKYFLPAQILVSFALQPAAFKMSYISQFPHWLHWPPFQQSKKEQKKIAKIQNLKFHNSFNNFGRDPPQEYTCILESKSGVFFQRRCALKLLLSYVNSPRWTKTNEKKMAKVQNLKFYNSLNNQLW